MNFRTTIAAALVGFASLAQAQQATGFMGSVEIDGPNGYIRAALQCVGTSPCVVPAHCTGYTTAEFPLNPVNVTGISVNYTQSLIDELSRQVHLSRVGNVEIELWTVVYQSKCFLKSTRIKTPQ